MTGNVILPGKALTDLRNALGVQTVTGELTYSATGSNYTNTAVSGISTADIDKYAVLVQTSANTIGVYGRLLNVSGSVVLQVRTDYRENETANTADFTAFIVRLAL